MFAEREAAGPFHLRVFLIAQTLVDLREQDVGSLYPRCRGGRAFR